ncbi:MAG: carboxypeptidase regulatory-like domain-containing protein [Acidobacteriota bacterium]|nr:MAG: carboxypeptidase regulatory-like domain-containing protein [Acidobacteriota bacterium]
MLKQYKKSTAFAMAAILLLAGLAPAGLAQTNTQSGKRSSDLLKTPTLAARTDGAKTGQGISFEGSNFAEYEPIDILVESVTEKAAVSGTVDLLAANSDGNGRFLFEWNIPFEGRFKITAKGGNSGLEASSIVHGNGSTPDPVLLYGHKSCKEVNKLNNTFPTITSDWGFKLNFWAPEGTFPIENDSNPNTVLTGDAPAEPSNSVTTDIWSYGKKLAWTSTRPIDAVIVTKYYNGHRYSNVYVYDPESMGDEGPLEAPYDQKIYTVEFCYRPRAKVIVVKHATPPSSFPFGFSTTGLGTPTFNLVDDDINSDPSMVFVTNAGIKTVTEVSPEPYVLSSVNCEVSGQGGSTTNVSLPGVTIDLKSGDTVTCTFNNDFLTANEAVIEGKVVDPAGNPITGVVVTATDTNGTTRSARTNGLGFYQIRELEAGSDLYVTAAHKQHVFGAQLVEIQEDVREVNFTALPR